MALYRLLNVTILTLFYDNDSETFNSENYPSSHTIIDPLNLDPALSGSSAPGRTGCRFIGATQAMSKMVSLNSSDARELREETEYA